MSTDFNRIAQQCGAPKWWVEAIVVEYLDCRTFAGPGEIWDFEFENVPDEAIRQALLTNRVVVHGTIFHNIHGTSLSSRMMGRLFSSVPVAAAISKGDLIAEGLVSAHHQVFIGNPIRVWDPKLSFSTHFQVLEDGQLWQWKIADFVSVQGRSYGKWVSEEINLESLDEVHPRLAELRDAPVKAGQPGHARFELKVREFYTWLETIRTPLRRKLHELHLSKRALHKGGGKTVPYAPPLMSQFEDFMVEGGEIYTRFHAEPIFYQALNTHSRRARELTPHPESAATLDQIYQERVQAVINAAACLESFINSIGSQCVPRWEFYKQLSPEAKWHLCLVIHGKDAQFDASREPYQSFGKIIELRNRWLHYQKSLEKVRVQTNKTVSWIEARMDGHFIETLPQKVAFLIEELCDAVGQDPPAWLKSGPGWDL